MRLLISVANADEARAAVSGGADVIDAKDPSRGALGAVSRDALRSIVSAVGGARPVSVALGDARDARAVAHEARAATVAQASYVKLGFAGVPDGDQVEAVLAAAVHAVQTLSSRVGVIAVAYADAVRAQAPSPLRMIEAAERVGATGVLLDTAFKDGRGLFGLMRPSAVGEWVHLARSAALTAAIAGQLTAADLPTVRTLGADLAGMRGAACEGGRTGRVTRERVAILARAAGRRPVTPLRSRAVPRADGDVTSRATPR